MITLSLKGDFLEIVKTEPIYARDINDPPTSVMFLLPDSWSSIDKKVVFLKEASTFRIAMDECYIIIPNVLMTQPGLMNIGLFGFSGDTLIPMKWSEAIPIVSR